ncbi:hypothetical protein BASA81_005649 [Batrachochytrium salamandrivorans]|nr:hypothetical protein BASA81_005649 [Batrachochytrium salamandrivorans]
MSLSKRSFEKYADIRYFLILQKVPLLAGLAREVQLEIVRRLKPAKFNPDELVVKQHDRGDAFFFITRGSALVFDEDDGDKIITRLYEGHSFGEMALMSDAPRVASVRSGSATELHCMFLSVQDFKELLSAEEFAELVDRESKKIRELRDKRTLFKQMRANSTNSFDTMGSPFRDADASPGDPKRLRAGSSQLAMPSANSPLLSPYHA